MRRTTLVPTLAALAALLVTPAHAAAPQVTDPAGDAPPGYDITAVSFAADAKTQRVSMTLNDDVPDGVVRYVVHTRTPSCDAVTIDWSTDWDVALLSGCQSRQQRRYAVPRWSGRTLTFAFARTALPSWWAPGTTLHGLAADVAPVVDFVAGRLFPQVDTASSTETYVLGS
ncbi:MAG: hypothetical protein QOE45_1929 [Frankiaceae bacterium]|jgi:hypothetical protein|nr:hypothetical protein [Frankiaceae bacterium]